MTKVKTTIAVLAAALLGTLLLMFTHQPTVNAQSETPVGAWLLSSSMADDSNIPNVLFIMHEDGTAISSTTRIFSNPESPYYGAWTQDGDIYRFSIVAFDPTGGQVRVNGTVSFISPDEISGEVTLDFISPMGAEQVGVASGTYTATRLKVVIPGA